MRQNDQHEHHDQKRHYDRIGRNVDRAELLGEADNKSAQRRAGDRSHATDDDDDERGEQEPDVLAGRDRLKRGAEDAGHAGETGAEGEDEDEHPLHADAHSRQEVARIGTGAPTSATTMNATTKLSIQDRVAMLIA